MKKKIKILVAILLGGLIFPNLVFSQDSIPEGFEFEAQWGTYGHYKVSSKEGKVYQKVTHDRYGHNPISFTKEEKQLVWNEISKIDFYSYPDTIPDCKWGLGYETKQKLRYDSILNEQTGLYELDSLNPEIIWEISIFFCKEIVPLSRYALVIYQDGGLKKVEWECESVYYSAIDLDRIITNHKIENLLNVLNLIYGFVENKDGFKNLPESNVKYE